MLNFMSWPSVLRNLITAVPRYFSNASHDLLSAIHALDEREYPQLAILEKIALLQFLVALAYNTEKIVREINMHVTARTDALKEHNRMLFQERKAAAEEDKQKKEQQKAEKSRVASGQKRAMQHWLKGGQKGTMRTTSLSSSSSYLTLGGGSDHGTSRANSPSPDEESTGHPSGVSEDELHQDSSQTEEEEDDDDDNHDEAEDEEDEDEDDEHANADDDGMAEEEELKRLQAKGIISRQEYLSRRRKLEQKQEEKRIAQDEKRKRRKQKEQQTRRRLLVAEEMSLAIEMKDMERLQSSLKAAKELGMHQDGKTKSRYRARDYPSYRASAAELKLVSEAEDLWDRLAAEAAREHELEERKEQFEKTMREYFIRTQALGKDKYRNQYWLFRGDSTRVYVEDNETKAWSFYDTPDDLMTFMAALDTRGIREHHLKKELQVHVDVLKKAMKKTLVKREANHHHHHLHSLPSKMELPIANDDMNMIKMENTTVALSRQSSSSNDDIVSGQHPLLSSWKNKGRSWPRDMLTSISVSDFATELIKVEQWLGKRLCEKGHLKHGSAHAPDFHWTKDEREQWSNQVRSSGSVQELIGPLLALERQVMGDEETKPGSGEVRHHKEQHDAKIHDNHDDDNGDQGVKKEEKVVDDDDEDMDEDENEDEVFVENGLWPSKKARERWIAAVQACKTLSALALSLASFVQRMYVVGLSEHNQHPQHAHATAAPPPKKKEQSASTSRKQGHADVVETESNHAAYTQEWDEDCCICGDGGELLCWYIDD
jgi:bromodomain adjacent to zinc finger domain protein 1A